MINDLIIYTSPEEEELALKMAELEALESELAENELNLTTFQAELHRGTSINCLVEKNDPDIKGYSQ